MIKIINIGPRGARIFKLEFRKKQQAVIRVHHPSCGHCKAMESDWKNLENILESGYTGDVNVFNVHADALPDINTPELQGIQGFPTILAIKDINGEKSTTYNGNRTSDDMLKFCLNNLDLEKILKVYQGGVSKRRNRKSSKRRNRKIKQKKKPQVKQKKKPQIKQKKKQKTLK